MKIIQGRVKSKYYPYPRPTTSVLRPLVRPKRQKFINDIIICQRQVRKWYARRKRKAMIISRASHNWVWKPICNDGTMGIRVKLDLEHLKVHGYLI
jgi:hypothetical protein